jgi:hypothetical protein
VGVRGICHLLIIAHPGQSFAADLFSVLHCQTVLIIKTEDPLLAASGMELLEKGVGLLRWTSEMRPSPKNRGLLEAANRLLSNAKQSRASVATDQFSPLWRDFLNFTSALASSSVAEQPNVWPTGEQILPAGPVLKEGRLLTHSLPAFSPQTRSCPEAKMIDRYRNVLVHHNLYEYRTHHNICPFLLFCLKILPRRPDWGYSPTTHQEDAS